jgi:hypothetical protein
VATNGREAKSDWLLIHFLCHVDKKYQIQHHQTSFFGLLSRNQEAVHHTLTILYSYRSIVVNTVDLRELVKYVVHMVVVEFLRILAQVLRVSNYTGCRLGDFLSPKDPLKSFLRASHIEPFASKLLGISYFQHSTSCFFLPKPSVSIVHFDCLTTHFPPCKLAK